MATAGNATEVQLILSALNRARGVIAEVQTQLNQLATVNQRSAVITDNARRINERASVALGNLGSQANRSAPAFGNLTNKINDVALAFVRRLTPAMLAFAAIRFGTQ